MTEEQAGLRPGRSLVEQIFNSPVIIEKHLHHQRDLFHNFIDLKKMFDRVLHAGLWQVLRSFNGKEVLVQAIQALYENPSGAVLLNSQIGEFSKTTRDGGEFFKTAVDVHQACLLSPILFNMFLEKIMLETPHDHHTLLPICSLRFANKSDLCVAAMVNLKDLTSTLVDTARAYEIEVSTENSKILTYSMKNFSVDTSMNIQKLKEVTNFKSLEQTCARVAPAQQRS